MQATVLHPQKKVPATSSSAKLTATKRWADALTKQELLDSLREELKTWEWQHEGKVLAAG